LATYLLNLVLLTIFSKITTMYISAAILLAPMAFISFILNKTFVFRGNHEKN